MNRISSEAYDSATWELTLFVIVEIAEEDEQFVLVPSQNVLNLFWLLGVGHEHLIRSQVHERTNVSAVGILR